MNKSLGKKILAVLAATAIPFTTLLSSAPLVANAADNYVTFDTKTSSVVTSSITGSTTIQGRSISETDGMELPYTYTGNIFTANSSLYDYLSDNEINGIERYSKAEGYADPYVQLNRAISEYNISVASPSSENLTVRYKPAKEKEGRYVNRYYVSVYLFQEGTGNNNGWPGKNMTYDAANEEFVYTIKYSDLGFSPNKFVISYTSKDSNGKDKSEKTGDISAALSKGKAYRYQDNGTVSEIGNADTIYNKGSNYDIPLYFGCFYLDDDPNDPIAGNYATHYEDYKKADGTYKGRAHNNYYRNFYWQANLSLRNDDSNQINFDASVQGLVDNTLTNGTITQNSKILPYFSDDWADSHSGLVKYWHNIAFPFYEIEVDANKVYGDGGTGKARYYQFNSKEGDKYSLYFEPDDVKKTGTYKETTTAVRSQPTTTDDAGTISYLPFNSENDYEKNALGFGMTFEMDFQIRADGMVDTYDSNGNRTGKSVNATFEFMGDDDVWVFIDDQLVLDLGGAHKDTTGIIDFAQRKVYANDAITLGAGKGKDDLSGNLSSQKIVNLKNVMTPDTFTANGKYNEEKVHTLRMFYMERGMYESDLLVRFNFSAIPNENNLKIREITRFENINAGLLDLTKKAADYDVFNYTVSNKGTAKDDVGESGIFTPTYNYYQRQNQELTANLTGKPLVYDTVISSDVFLDTNNILSGGNRWDNDCQIAAWIWKEGSEGQLYFGTETSSHLYRFSGFPSDANKAVFFRLNKNTNYDSYTWPSFYNRSSEMSLEPGYTYRIDGWDNSVTKTVQVKETVVHYDEEKNFNPNNGNAVANTNYTWTDEFAVKTSGSEPDGMTSTTDNNGSFNLMYGTDEKESSAEFKRQFKKDSTMYVDQNDNLWIIGRENDDVGAFSKPETNDRTVSEYYNTTVTVKDSQERLILSKGSNDNPAQTQYSYKNGEGADENDPVQLIETFVNTPKVGAITVTKQLNPDDNVTDNFAFTISLYDAFGVEGMNVTDYSTIVATINGIPTTLGTDGTFTLKRGETLTIQGVPYGTKYTVTETPAKDYEQQSTTADSEQKVYTGTFDDTTAEKVQIIPAEANQETVVNTRKTNSLTLSKVLKGDYSSTNIDGDTPFDFEVTFTAPTGVDLAKYTFETDPAGIAITNNYKFTVSVSENQPVEISGIPYGTTYTVKEITAIDENWSNDGEQTGEIGETASTATITNTYTPPAPKYGSLKVSKNVRGANNSDDIPDEMKQQRFTFTVTLKNAAGEPVSGVFNTRYYLNDTETGSGTVTFNASGEYTLILKDDESIVISDIPVDTVYTVEETVNAEYEQTFTGADSGTIEENVTAEVKFTNTKKFIPYTLPESGFEDTRIYFVFTLSGMMLCGLAYFFINRKKISN